MKKILKLAVVVLSIFLLVGCENKSNKKEEVINEPKIIESKLKEGKYVQIAPSDEGSQGAGYENYLTLEHGKAIKFDSYFEITTEGSYVVEDDIVTVTYERTYGKTTYGEDYDDPYNATYTYHIEDDRIILDKMSDFDGYQKGLVIYQLK